MTPAERTLVQTRIKEFRESERRLRLSGERARADNCQHVAMVLEQLLVDLEQQSEAA